ncbi:pentapeptide repeat-containing protein [Desulfopila sp. IMCC35008]|uniref:pentapeptide repeat-containing protein n=1 Tax=Desulfopila sp. IMCC35008 TaxID=2653858 RepID=UPI00197AD527|nr:pentapeptide repeat-containing protein [Desulfopila sp. IMCC35008]
MLRHYILLFSALTLLSAGCAVNSRTQMEANGISALSAEEIYTLLADRTLHLTSMDFDGKILFLQNGSLSAHNRDNQKDSGEWDITTDSELCIEFRTWFYGDRHCYTLFPDSKENSYIFFSANGARSYSAVQLRTTPEGLRPQKKKKKESYLKQKNSPAQPPEQVTSAVQAQPRQQPPGPLPSKEEMKHLLVKTARNCPECNLAGADLSRANLVEANLAGADLSGANLRGANLRRANLAGANLNRANLTLANLPGANLRGCNLENADFTKANLIKADFTQARTEGAVFNTTHLEGTIGLK